MKICFFRHSLLNRGGDKMVVEYANFLKSRGQNVVISANVEDTIFDVLPPVEKISTKNSKIGTIISAAFAKRDSDIIVADIIAVVFLLALRNSKKIVYFAQDYDEAYYKSFFMKILIRFLYSCCLRNMKIPVIAVSEELGELLKQRFHANVKIVQNGVDTDLFYRDRDAEYLSLKGNSKVILVFARRDYRKGFDIAIKVLLALRKDIEDGNFMVWAVGEDIDVPFTIKNFGFVPPEKLRKILSCSDVLLYPSRHEGLPLLVLEALACGCPIVTTEAVRFLRKTKFSPFLSRIDDVESLRTSLIDNIENRSQHKDLIKEGLSLTKRYSLQESKTKFEEELLSLRTLSRN